MIIIIIVVLIGLLILRKEHFDGVGKGFSVYYRPQECCKSKDCYPGMYLGNDFWENR